jgi:hypothetical protein
MNTDLIHSLLVSLDPFITNLRPLPRKRTSGISKDMLQLISLAHQQLCESSDLDGTESGTAKMRRAQNSVLLTWFLYLLCLINTVIMLNKCQFTHFVASSNYFIQQDRHHT